MNELKGKKFVLSGTIINSEGLRDYMVSLGMVDNGSVRGSDYVIHEGLLNYKWGTANVIGVHMYNVDRFVRDVVGVSGRDCDCSQGYPYKGMCSVCGNYWASPAQASAYIKDWDGKGLPPVGTKCLHDYANSINTFFKKFQDKVLTIIAHDMTPAGKPCAVFSYEVEGGCHYHALVGGFKPRKTDKELAHEKLVDKLQDLLSMSHGGANYQKYAETIIKAGYRKHAPMNRDFSKGDDVIPGVFPGNVAAGISCPGHINVIECHAGTKEGAELLRDEILERLC